MILGVLSALTVGVDMLSNVETIDAPSVLRVFIAVLLGYVIPYFGDTNKDGTVSIADLPKEWQDILAGIGGAPSPLDQQPANSNGVLAAVPRIDSNVK